MTICCTVPTLRVVAGPAGYCVFAGIRLLFGPKPEGVAVTWAYREAKQRPDVKKISIYRPDGTVKDDWLGR
jgi:hypothetical protein